MPSNIEDMAKNNLDVLKTYHLEKYIQSSTNKKAQIGGNLFMKKYLSEKQFELFQLLISLEDDFNIKKEKPLVDEILKNDVSLIVIRPEMTHYLNSIKHFIKQIGLIPIYEISLKLSREQYWDIYHRGITDKRAHNTMPTRTLVYTSSNVVVIVFKSLIQKSNKHIADILFNEYKGEAGKYSPTTLRGDIIFKEAQRIGLDNIDMNSTLSLAIDPFGAYRHLLKSKFSNAEDLKRHLLNLTSVSIHIPSYKELGRDLSVLFNKEQLTSIINQL